MYIAGGKIPILFFAAILVAGGLLQDVCATLTEEAAARQWPRTKGRKIDLYMKITH